MTVKFLPGKNKNRLLLEMRLSLAKEHNLFSLLFALNFNCLYNDHIVSLTFVRQSFFSGLTFSMTSPYAFTKFKIHAKLNNPKIFKLMVAKTKALTCISNLIILKNNIALSNRIA